MDLVDIGLNLAHKRFDRDRAEVVARAVAAGVRQMVITGTDLPASEAAAALAAPGTLFATAGIHPHHADTASDAALARLAALARRPEVVAIGECGLDFFRDFSPRPDQERAFEAQLQLAADLDMPAFLHERDAGERFFALVAAHRDRLPAVVLHCFTGGREALHAALDLDLHLGITGWICDERRGTELREIVREIPANRLMVETDAPFLVPRDLRPKPEGGRNEPAFLPHVLRAVAAARDESPEVTARATTATARAFFALPDPPG